MRIYFTFFLLLCLALLIYYDCVALSHFYDELALIDGKNFNDISKKTYQKDIKIIFNHSLASTHLSLVLKNYFFYNFKKTILNEITIYLLWRQHPF